eukprot:m.10021 g.10021  ORF g.10021 m.10021 type:complete len:430 (-) comp8069_c0_seq1:68-1357(-)
MSKMVMYLCLVSCTCSFADAASSLPKIFTDSMKGWTAFRDPNNGLWCDSVQFPVGPVCGKTNNVYSSAGTGMGLVSDAIQAELGLISQSTGEQRVVQTLETVLASWPRDTHTGFFVHFTNAQFLAKSEYSTIDTAEMVLGARLAGNYFKGHALTLSQRLMVLVTWQDAIEAANSPTIFPVVNATTGVLSGNIRPYNEYYLVAYLAMLTSPDNTTKAAKYFNTYYRAGPNGPRGDGTWPVFKDYWGDNLLTDNNNTFMSSFIPQFCYYLSKEFHDSSYFSGKMLPQWLNADQKFWSLALDENAHVWGKPVKGKVFGCGAGPGPSGYHVERINKSENLVVSAAIMAGFLPIATTEQKQTINAQLEWLYQNKVCAYELAVVDPAETINMLWRCSIKQPSWRARSMDSIDISTLVLGLATNHLPPSFYSTYAV